MDWTVGGVAVASAAVATVAVAKFAKWRVNCWFCNGNQWVPVRERHHFTCECCGQYNGFTEDGGYDRMIREQHRVIPTNKRFATAEGFQPGVSDSPFCARCEDAMERRRRATAEWEPNDEDNWAAEYDEYRMRMERLYPLCERCEMNTQRRLTANKQRYKYLHNLKSHLFGLRGSSIVSGLTSVSRMAARKVASTSRRRFFSGGPLTTKLQLGAMTIAGVLMMTLLDTLLSDCGMDSLPLPDRLRSALTLVLPHSFHISLVAATAHILSLATNKNRISLPDLVTIPSLIWLSICLQSPIEGENALQAVAASSCLFLLLTAVAVLPRKRKHRKRPNYVINSAFSVASTPVSQVSSQADSFLLPSPRDENWSPMRDEGMGGGGGGGGGGSGVGVKTPLTSNNARFNRFRENNVISTPTDMEWEQSEVCSPISPSTRGSPQGRSQFGAPPLTRSPLSMRNGQQVLWREQRREETPDRSTPAREIATKLGAFSMRDENEEDDGWGVRKRGGPFPSSSSHFGVASNNGRMNGGGFGQPSRTPSMVSFQSRTPSIRSLATAKSTFSESRRGLIPPSLARFNDRSSPTGASSVVHSHLTSASQQMNESRGFFYLILILTFTSVCTFVGMIILFYHTFYR